MLYTFMLQDRSGQDHQVEALGIDLITDIPAKIDLRQVANVFPHAPAEVLERPAGQVDILLGANYRHLQPAGGLKWDGCAVDGL